MKEKGSILAWIAVVALLVVCYLPSLGGGFLWDDVDNVSDNAMLRDLQGLADTWLSPFANIQFYPLTHTSFWIEYQLWGASPTGYRITNLLLHALVALSLGHLLFRLRVPGAWLAAALFALHPVHVESVAWITERKNLLSALFFIASVSSYAIFAGLNGAGDVREGSRRRYGLALLLYVVAMLSKTAVLVLPAVLLVLVWWKKDRLRSVDFMRTVPFFAVGGIFGAVTVWLEQSHLGASGPGWDLTIVERLIVAGRALWFYAWKLVVPVNLSFIYPRWEIDGGSPSQYLFSIGVVLALVALFRLRGRIGKAPLAAVLVFVVAVAPALGFLDFYFQIYSFVQDHFQYLASAGLIALVTGSLTIASRRIDGTVRTVAAAILLLALAASTWQRSHAFRSEEALWTDTIAKNPGAWMAHFNLGRVYEERGNAEVALEHYRASLDSDPDRVRGHLRLAHRLVSLGRAAEAEQQFRDALNADPGSVDAHWELATLFAGQARHREAAQSWQAVVELDAGRAEAYYNLGLSLEALGRTPESEARYRDAVRLDPILPDPHNALAILLYRSGRYDEARRELARFRELGGTPHPDFVRALSAVSPR